MNKLIVLGPGHSVKSQADKIKQKRHQYKVLAFQRTYPHCKTLLDIEPDYWFATDPFGFIEGMEHILKQNKATNIEVLIPSFFVGSVTQYKKYCGSSPLLRIQNGWERFQSYIDQIKQHCKVRIVPSTSTKFIDTFSNNIDLKDNIFGEDPYYRFMHEEAIIGSVPFDSESVIGSKFVWGLENKLSSSVFPVCYHLRATDVHIIGFDLYGPRFYNDDSRHPWNDETQIDDVVMVPLGIIQKWTKWKNIHRMNIYNSSAKEETLLSKVLETREI